MAATGRKTGEKLRFLIFRAILACTLAVLPLRADRIDEIRERIAYVATALSSGNASDAMTPFDKSMKDYEKLRSDFRELTDAFEVRNELDITDEQDTETETAVTVNWTLTLTQRTSGYTDRRDADISIRLRREKGKWMIVDLSPVDFFNPQQRPNHKLP